MAGTYTNLLYHIVFSTKNRLNLLTSALEPEMHRYIGGVIKGEGGVPLEIGGMSDHVHVLCKLKPTICVSDLLMRVKSHSSKWANEEKLKIRKFAWQEGYGAFTVSESQVAAVRVYIQNQKRHHARKSYQDEFRELLARHSIDFDEKYLW